MGKDLAEIYVPFVRPTETFSAMLVARGSLSTFEQMQTMRDRAGRRLVYIEEAEAHYSATVPVAP